MRWLSMICLSIKVNALNRILLSISRPGIAIDISKQRDVVSTVVTEFQKCEIPKPSAGGR